MLTSPLRRRKQTHRALQSKPSPRRSATPMPPSTASSTSSSTCSAGRRSAALGRRFMGPGRLRRLPHEPVMRAGARDRWRPSRHRL